MVRCECRVAEPATPGMPPLAEFATDMAERAAFACQQCAVIGAVQISVKDTALVFGGRNRPAVRAIGVQRPRDLRDHH